MQIKGDFFYSRLSVEFSPPEARGGDAFPAMVTAAYPIKDCGEIIIRLLPGCVSRFLRRSCFLIVLVGDTGGSPS